MKDLDIYLSPVKKGVWDTSGESSQWNSNVKVHLESIPELENIKIAIIGVKETRGSEFTSKDNPTDIDAIRKYLGHLEWFERFPEVADLGDILSGNNLGDTYFALETVVNLLIKKDIIPLIIGGSQDLTFAQYKGYEKQYAFLKDALQDSIRDANAELTFAFSLGLPQLGKSLSERINAAKRSLTEASIYSTNDIGHAIGILETAIKDIQKASTKINPQETVRKNAQKFSAIAESISKELHSAGLKDSNSTRMLSSIRTYYSSVLENLSKGKYAGASHWLNKLEHAVADLNSHFGSLIEARAKKLAEDLDFVFYVSRTFQSKIAFLKKQLEETPQSLLVDARYVPDFDETSLNVLEKRLNKSKESIWSELDAIIESTPLNALKLANRKNIYAKVSHIKKAYTELQALKTNLKTVADHYIQSLEKRAHNHRAVRSLAASARKKFLNGHYLQALAMSKTALSTLGEHRLSDLYVVILLAFLVSAAVFIKIRGNKKHQIKTFQKVLRGSGYY